MSDEKAVAFDPDQIALINTAYEDALHRLGIHASFVERRALLAKFVMDLAREGETDAVRLRDAAVSAVKRFDWIRHQAHELWEGEGRPHGRDKDHWSKAETEFEGWKSEID